MEQIPILMVGRCLLVSIQIDMDDKLAMALQDDFAQKLVETRARGIGIDISTLDLVDSFIGRMLSTLQPLRGFSTRKPLSSACDRKWRLRWSNSVLPCRTFELRSTWIEDSP